MQTLADLVLAASAKPRAGGAAEQPSCLGAGEGRRAGWKLVDLRQSQVARDSEGKVWRPCLQGRHSLARIPVGLSPRGRRELSLTAVPALRLPGRAGWAGCSLPGPTVLSGSSKIFNACSHLRASNNLDCREADCD